MFGVSQFQGAARLPGFLSQLETGNEYANSGHMRMYLCLRINRLYFWRFILLKKNSHIILNP